MKRLLIDQQDITQVKLDEVAQSPLAQGDARLRIRTVAVTANNVTYAATGSVLGYWQFFPTGVDGRGQLPVWGMAEVVESQSDALAEGTQLYGFYPLAEALVITPQVDAQGMIIDTAPHRAELPAVYNRYAPVRAGDARQDDLRALLQPLLATAYLIFDWLADNDCFGAEQVIVGSASSKTGLGLCKYLAELENRDYRIIGLTSQGNRAFVEGLNACDEVFSYDEVDRIAQVPSVFVDMAGNSAVKAALHGHLAAVLKHSAAVGTSHWDQFQPKQSVPGPKPQFFFAPTHIAKRRDEWGPGEIEKRAAAAWKRLATQAERWLTVRVHDGIASAPEVYTELAEGRADPRDGHVIHL